MLLMRNAVHRLVISPVLVIAPPDRFVVEVRDVSKAPAGDEVILHKPDEPFHLSFGERVARFAELCPESGCLHEALILEVPDRLPVHIPSGCHALHVVREDVFRDSHAQEAVDHADEQILLFCIREEFYETLPTVMADHRKAGSPVRTAVPLLDGDEPPVHLVTLTRPGMIAPPAVSLRRHQAPRGGDEILMAMDVFLQLCPLAGVSVFANLIQDNFRVGDSLPQEVIDDGCVPGQHGLLPVSPPGSTREHNEAVFLQPAEPLPGNAGSPAELREIDLFRVE